LVKLEDLTNAIAETLRNIPDLIEDLGGDPARVIPYIDEQPLKNSVSAAIYQMKPGTVLVLWQQTLFNRGEMEGWTHVEQIYVRAQSGQSALVLINDIVNGVPDPGDGQRWRYCPVMDGVLPTMVIEIARLIDEEGLDYYAITTETNETGDV